MTALADVQLLVRIIRRAGMPTLLQSVPQSGILRRRLAPLDDPSSASHFVSLDCARRGQLAPRDASHPDSNLEDTDVVLAEPAWWSRKLS